MNSTDSIKKRFPRGRLTRPSLAISMFLTFSTLLALLLTGCSSTTDTTPVATAPPAPDFCQATTASGREITQVGTPTEYLDPKTYLLTLETNCGVIEIAADAAKAPVTVTSLGFLANAQYFDSSICHRLTTSGIFVLQCGDPSATGSGGPGFTFKDENLPSQSGVNYPKGTIAMANSGPNTNGSQFFIVYQDTILPPNYSIWGKVTKGLDIVEKIAANGTANGQPDGSPKYPVEIKTARLS